MKNLLCISSLLLIFSADLSAQTEVASFQSEVSKLASFVKKQDSTAYLFEVEGLILNQNDILKPIVYFASFASSKNLITYKTAGFSGNEDIYLTENYFIRGFCGGIGCAPPPLKSEPLAAHPEIGAWKLDFVQIKAVLKNAKFEIENDSSVALRLTTLARLEASRYFQETSDETQANLKNQLKRIPKSTIVYRVVTSSVPVHTYILIDATSGKVLSQGTYRQLPPRPGAVSSGG